MRISDWSSDVCSSDLLGVRCNRRDPQGLPALDLFGDLRSPEGPPCLRMGNGADFPPELSISGRLDGVPSELAALCGNPVSEVTRNVIAQAFEAPADPAGDRASYRPDYGRSNFPGDGDRKRKENGRAT